MFKKLKAVLDYLSVYKNAVWHEPGKPEPDPGPLAEACEEKKKKRKKKRIFPLAK